MKHWRRWIHEKWFMNNENVLIIKSVSINGKNRLTMKTYQKDFRCDQSKDILI